MPAFIVIAPSMDAIAHFQKSLKGPYLMDQLLNFHPDLNKPQTDKRNKIYYAIANPTSPEEVMTLIVNAANARAAFLNEFIMMIKEDHPGDYLYQLVRFKRGASGVSSKDLQSLLKGTGLY